MDPRKEPLFLHEEVTLLALSDRAGTVELGAWYQQAAGAAILAELLLAGRIRLVKRGRRTFVEAVGGEPLGDGLLDEWLGRIRSEPKPRKLRDWVAKAAYTRNLKHRVAGRLVERSVLHAREQRVLLLFRRTVYPQRDPSFERSIRDRLHAAVFSEKIDVDPRTVALLSLARSTGLLDLAFGRKALKPRRARIERIVNGEATGPAARELIESLEATIVAACVVPVVST